MLAEQEAQNQEGDDVREEDPGGVCQAGTHQVGLPIVIFFFLKGN